MPSHAARNGYLGKKKNPNPIAEHEDVPVPLVNCPICVPSRLLAQPQCALWGWVGGEGEKEKSLMLSKNSSTIAKILVCYQICLDHKSRTQAAMK